MQNNRQTHIFQQQVKTLIKTLKCLQSDDKYQALLFLISAIKLYIKLSYSCERERIFKPYLLKELTNMQNVILLKAISSRGKNEELTINHIKNEFSSSSMEMAEVKPLKPDLIPWNLNGKLLRSNLFDMIPQSSTTTKTHSNFVRKHVGWIGNIKMNRSLVRTISRNNFKFLFNMFEQNIFPLTSILRNVERRKVPAAAICYNSQEEDHHQEENRFVEIRGDESNISMIKEEDSVDINGMFSEESTNNTSLMLSSDTNTLDTNDSSFTTTQAKQEGKQIFNCLLCDKSYRKRKSLVIHFTHHPGFCPDCGKHRGTTSAEIVEHNKIYHKDRPHICEHCGETFTRNQQFQVHVQGHITPKFKAKSETPKHICRTCDTHFNNEKLLEKHLQTTNHQTDGVICELCGTWCGSNIKLCQHMIRVHKNAKKFACEHCSKEFSQKANLDRHILTHTNLDKTFICEHCGSSYLSQASMRDHIKSAHSETKFECNICNKLFAAKRSLKRHKLTHSEERAYPCKIGDCKEAYKNQSHLSRHQKSAHNIEPPSKRSQKLIKNENGELVPLAQSEPKAKKFKPSEPNDFDEGTSATTSSIGSKFNDNLPASYNSYDYPVSEPPQMQPSSQTNLVSNSYPPGEPPPIAYHSNEQPFEWQSMERNMNSHVLGGAVTPGGMGGGSSSGSSHQNAYLDPPPHGGNNFHDIKQNSQQFINNNLNMHSYQENKIICEHCDESFHNNQQYQNHVQEHYGSKDLKDSKKLLKLSCRTCNLLFSNHIQLEKHVQKTNHQIDGLVCEFCSAIFMTTVKLSQHLIKNHNNETWFTCEHCSKIFIVKSDLDRHLLLHANTPDKTFMCEHCGSAFYSQDALKEHIKNSHGAEKKYECDICHKLFAAQRSLKRHRLCHSEDNTFPCPVEPCRDSFKTQALLSKHKKMIHALEEVKPSKGKKIDIKKEYETGNLMVSPGGGAGNPPNLPCYGYDSNMPYNNVMNAPSNQQQQFAVQQPPLNYAEPNLNYRMDMNSAQAPGDHYGTNYALADNSFEWQNMQNMELCNPQASTSGMDKSNMYVNPNAGFIDMNKVPDPQQLMDINNQEFVGYQDIWSTGMVKMEPEYDVNAANVQGNSYNSIGNILSNLELIGNNSNFEQNFDIVTSHSVEQQQQKNPYQNQPKPNPLMNVDNNLVNPHHHHQHQYFQPSQMQQYNQPPPPQHLQPRPEFSGQPQNHTITDISKTNNNLQYVDSFTESIDYLQQSYQYV